MTTKSSADAARTRALLRRSKRRRGDRGEGCGNPRGCLTCVCCIPEPTRATSNDGHAFHSRSHPPFPSHHLHRNRDALGRKVEADVEAKTDFNALKNQWDSIEKDFHTWSKEVRREEGKKGRKEGGKKGTREGGKKKKACNSKLVPSIRQQRFIHPLLRPSPSGRSHRLDQVQGQYRGAGFR